MTSTSTGISGPANSIRSDWSYLVREAVSILLLGYLMLAGGTLTGLVRFPFHIISHVLLAIIVAVWLGGIFWHRRYLEDTGLEIAILVVLAVQGITTVSSTDPRRSLGWLGLIILYTLWLYLVYDVLKHGWPAELMVKSLLTIGAILIAWGSVEIVTWYAAWLRQSGGQQLIPTNPLRVYSLLGDANMLSGFLNLLLPLALVRLLTARGGFTRIVLACWVGGNLLVQFFTSSRGGWLGTLVAVASLTVLALLSGGWQTRARQLWQTWRGRRWALVLVSLVALLALLVVAYLGWHQLRHPSHGGIWVARQDFWRSAWSAFLSSPLYGTGPFTYGTQFFKYTAVPPWRPYPHAHSVPLTVLAEGGVLGFLSLTWLVVALWRRLQGAWFEAAPPRRLFMAGGLASLAGFSAHSLLDNHIGVPAIGLTTVGILALTLAESRAGEDGAPNRAPHPLRARIHPALVMVPAILLIAGGLWSDWAYRPFAAGVEAADAGRWEEAARLIDQAVQRDGRLAFYSLQDGYVWGVLAAEGGKEQALSNAIHAYQQGIEIEPDYSLNHANLAALYWQAGQRDKADVEMERALSLAPDVALYHLNMARYAEEMGNPGLAQKHYLDVLSERPDLADAGHYWKRTSVRQGALAEWKSKQPPSVLPDPPVSASDYMSVGWNAYRREDFAAAQEAFRRASVLAPAESGPYYGLGLAYMARKNYERAEYYLQVGLDIFTLDQGSKLDLLLAYGELAHRQGLPKEAITRYEVALSMVERPTIYGRGTMGWCPYGWFLFQRESIAPDLLPQLARLEVTDQVASRFVELAQWYEEVDRQEEAAKAYRRILSIVPDFEPALIGLAHLMGANRGG